ncbi:MAG: hypothetical protein M3388_12470 [Acidobacteriota bacterium]|nr:hypothetical protein [Acidobacteriota bacterium]
MSKDKASLFAWARISGIAIDFHKMPFSAVPLVRILLEITPPQSIVLPSGVATNHIQS